MRRLLLRLYPAPWRARYGDEFERVLADRPLGPFDVADVLLGALDAQLHLRGLGAASQHGRGLTMSLRIGGYAAIAGSLLWIAGMFAASANGSDDDLLPQAAAAAGTTLLLVALAGLSAFQARRFPRVVWAACALPAIGAMVSVAGIVALALTDDRPIALGLAAWDVWIIGVFALVGGSGLFGAATWRAGVLSRAGSALLGAAALGSVAMLVNALGLLPWEPVVSVAFLGLLASFVAGWVLLGVSAIRTDRLVLAPGAGA